LNTRAFNLERKGGLTMKNPVWIPVVVTVLLSPLAARAASIEAQTIELDTRFSYQHTSVSVDLPFGDEEDYGVTLFDLRLGAGYFFTPNWELGGALIVDHTGIDEFGVTDFGFQANGYYNFTTSGSVIPFVGLGLGFVFHNGDLTGDEDDTTMIVPELVGGLRWLFRDVVSLNATAGYRHLESPEVIFGSVDGTGDEFFLAFGFSFFLQGGGQ
jgi:hypothetical protein